MNIQTRIFAGILIVVVIGFYALISWITEDIKPQFRKVTEEPLVDASRTLASVAAMTVKEGKVDVDLFRKAFDDVYNRPFKAKIYEFVKREVDFRVYMTDKKGMLIFDSRKRGEEGKDYSQWNDVFYTLKGEHGVRTTREVPGDPGTSVMYVASPITWDGDIVGVLSVGNPSKAANRFVEGARNKIIIVAIIVALAVIVVGIPLSRMITSPIKSLTTYARAVREGERIDLPPLGKSEIKELGAAFEEMRTALDGKQYVENYVQSLTHEVKAPLSAIQGAVELLTEDMPPDQQARFFKNIRTETDRIRMIVDKLLLLASIESKKSIHDVENLNMGEIIEDIEKSLAPLLHEKKLVLEIKGDKKGSFEGDPFLVRQAVVNLIKNAIDFSPAGEKIEMEISESSDAGSIILTVSDKGSGIPDYALNKVYERFYSLKRPDSGKKSSGLGLSLVKEVTLLHHGKIELRNGEKRGAVAKLTLPVRFSRAV
ncbi:MAG: two-component system sensor histidine kinase CreC [Deltaproteobacteria bacterium]|nr:two-component system sensor histidine kinase CreC [Deltaproteobacteria bacterium]